MVVWLARFWADQGLAGGALGIATPFIIAGLLYLRRAELGGLAKPSPEPEPAGQALLAVGLVLSLAGSALEMVHLLALGLPVALHGYLWWTRGRARLGAALMPLYMLVFLVPWSYGALSRASWPLQLASAWMAEVWLKLGGLPVWREENILHLGDTTNRVVESCSGMSTLSALLLYALVFGHIFKLAPRSAGMLVAAIFPLALLANGARIAAISVMLYRWGEEVANGPWHDGSGHLAFALCYGLLLLLMRWLKRREAKAPA